MYTLVHAMHSYVNGPVHCILFQNIVHIHKCIGTLHLQCTLLHKWNLMRRYSCTIHLHTYTRTPWQTLNLSNDGTHTTHTCTLHARSVLLNLSIAHALAFYSIELVICMYERPLIRFSISVLWLGFCTCSAITIHSWISHACEAPLWLVLCTYHETWDSQQLSLRRNATVLFIHSRCCLCLARSAFVLYTCSEFHLLFLTTRCRCSVTVLST